MTRTLLRAVIVLGLISCSAKPPAGAPPSARTSQVDGAKGSEHARCVNAVDRLIAGLWNSVSIRAYVTRGTLTLDSYSNRLSNVLNQLASRSRGTIRIELVELSRSDKAKAEEVGLTPIGSPDGAAPLYMGLTMRVREKTVVVPSLPLDRPGSLTFLVASKLGEVHDEATGVRRQVGVVTAKDELALSDAHLIVNKPGGKLPSVQSIIEQAFPFYALSKVDLEGGRKPIRKELQGLIVTQPRRPYSERELQRIDEFLMLGGKAVAVFASAVTLAPSDPTFSATLDLHGLERLLAGYGIVMRADAVFDYGAPLSFPVLLPEGRRSEFRYPPIALLSPWGEARLEASSLPFWQMEKLPFPFPSTLELDRTAQPTDVSLDTLAQTSSESRFTEEHRVDLGLNNPNHAWRHARPRVIAAAAEGRLRSAFGPVPRRRAGGISRVLVVASSQYLTNPFAHAANPQGSDAEILAKLSEAYANAHLTSILVSVKNVLGWMTGDAEIAACGL